MTNARKERRSMNDITIVGNLGQDPERQTYQRDGDEVVYCKLSVAVQKQQRGGQDQSPDWFDVRVFGGQAQPCLEYLSKGRTVAVNGRMESSTVTEPGSDRSRKYWNLVANRVEFLGGGDQASRSEDSTSQDAGEKPKVNLPF